MVLRMCGRRLLVSDGGCSETADASSAAPYRVLQAAPDARLYAVFDPAELTRVAQRALASDVRPAAPEAKAGVQARESGGVPFALQLGHQRIALRLTQLPAAAAAQAEAWLARSSQLASLIGFLRAADLPGGPRAALGAVASVQAPR